MTKSTHRTVSMLAYAIGLIACDGRGPSEPTPPPPTVTAIAPSMGSTARPTPVTISGTGFLAGATVTVDAVALNATVVNSTTITAMAPAHRAGPADVVVTNRGGSGVTLAGAFAYAFEEPFTVTASTDAVDAGDPMSVSWTAPGAQPRDWLALFKVGASYDDDWHGVTTGAKSGTLTLTAPTRPGQYEFRYLFDGGFLDVARSKPVTVRLPLPTVTAIAPSMGSTARPTRVTISGTGFLAGATVTVDAVALNVTVANSTTITAIAPAHAAGPADVVVTNPGGSGGTLPAAFTYAFEEPFTVTANTDAVDAGGPMSVSWTAPGAQPRDWLALFKVGASYDDDWYDVTNGAKSGTLTLTAPARPGQYEFRYLFDGDFLDVARSKPVTVR